jgi:hypothetical protein
MLQSWKEMCHLAGTQQLVISTDALQYQTETKVCKLGDPVRLGFEGSDTANWCDPHPPSEWSGQQLASRKDGVCEWGKSLPNQCFGLGPERMNPITKQPLSAKECEAECCQSSNCEMWQHGEGRGCYFAPAAGIGCDEKKEPTYIGGRKCIPGFCGSLEEELQILSAFNSTKKTLRQNQDETNSRLIN